jgi:hypothetical protein
VAGGAPVFLNRYSLCAKNVAAVAVPGCRGRHRCSCGRRPHIDGESPGHDDIANIGFVVGATCVAVIDIGGSVTIGRALRASISAHTSVALAAEEAQNAANWYRGIVAESFGA